MIAPWTMFDHTAVVLPELDSGSTTWIGRARRVDTARPGWVGAEPRILIVGNRITLESAETNEEVEGDPDRPFDKQPVSAVSTEIGPILDELLAPGDQIRIVRGSQGGLSILVHRDRQMIFAVGSLCGSLTEGEPVIVRDDPRRRLANETGETRRPDDLKLEFHSGHEVIRLECMKKGGSGRSSFAPNSRRGRTDFAPVSPPSSGNPTASERTVCSTRRS